MVLSSLGSLGRSATGLVLAGLAVAPTAASLALAGSTLLVAQPARADANQILLVSYAVTKAAYDKIIPLFVADYKQKTGEQVTVVGKN